MDNRDYMKMIGECLCSTAPNSMVKSLTHDSIRAMYERDYIVVTNLCNDFEYLPEISMNTIDGAKERYKEYNKSRLEVSPLSENEKKQISAQIDCNAERLKQDWINTLQSKNIKITE